MSSGDEIVAADPTAVHARAARMVGAAGPRSGSVVVSRVSDGHRDLVRRYAVMIDDVQVGSIGRGQTQIFEVPAGRHKVQLKISWCTSNALMAVIEPGSTASFVCAPAGEAVEALAAVTVNAGTYITLKRTPEPIFMTKAPLDRRTRVIIGVGVGFFGGAVTFIAALIWRSTGVAIEASNVVASAGIAVTATSMVVGRFLLHRRTARRRQT